MKAQRLRFRYRLTPEGLGMGHRDIVHAWEQAAREGGLAVAMSEGKRPAPQISQAAPLPQGATSDAEIIEIYLAEAINPAEALTRVTARLPRGIEAVEVREIGVSAPSVQGSLRWAEYEVDVPAADRSDDDLRCAIERLLAATTLPAEYKRETKTKAYDLRPLVLGVRFLGRDGDLLRLEMRLRAEQNNTARADQVVLALGLPEATRVHRKRLVVEEVPAVLLAYRRAGEGEG